MWDVNCISVDKETYLRYVSVGDLMHTTDCHGWNDLIENNWNCISRNWEDGDSLIKRRNIEKIGFECKI